MAQISPTLRDLLFLFFIFDYFICDETDFYLRRCFPLSMSAEVIYMKHLCMPHCDNSKGSNQRKPLNYIGSYRANCTTRFFYFPPQNALQFLFIIPALFVAYCITPTFCSFNFKSLLRVLAIALKTCIWSCSSASQVNRRTFWNLEQYLWREEGTYITYVVKLCNSGSYNMLWDT